MSQLSLVCLSLTPNLRCVGFTVGQFVALVIPTGIETIIALLFIYLYSGPGRWAQILLAADSILYFVWALLDMLSRVVPAARNSLSVFKALDFLVGAVSFTPILIYSVYLYRLSFHDLIPTLPRKLHPYLEISLPILLIIAVALNEVSSFVGTHLRATSNTHLIVEFSNNSESLWLSLSQSSLGVYAIFQFIFFLLAFSRLSRAFLDQRRIKLAQSDEHHFFRGIAWINAGVIIGVIETITGFARVSFGVSLARRILRLIARVVLLYGLLKGPDVAENFENLADELRGASRIGKHISHMLGVGPRRASMFRRLSQTHMDQLRSEQSTTEKRSVDQRVTVHYEKGHAPFLQIRFSVLDFPAQAILADIIQQRRRSLSGLTRGHASGSGTQDSETPDDMTAVRNAASKTRRAKSALMPIGNEWIPPPPKGHTRQGSGGTVSDSLSIVRDLERRFPLPPRVTGKYRGSILGQNYEEDPFPVIGVSRQSSMRRDDNAPDTSEEGGTSVALSSSGSIKRKPAPPLLDNIAYISERRKRPTSTWGGLTVDTTSRPIDSPMVSNGPWEGSAMVYSSDPVAEPIAPTTSRPRRRSTARDLIQRASRALSDASIRSAEWFASASSPQTALTAADIEMYRRGSLGPSLARLEYSTDDAGLFGENTVPNTDRKFAETHPKPPFPRVSIGRIAMQRTPTPTPVDPGPGSPRAPSLHGSVNLLEGAESKAARQ